MKSGGGHVSQFVFLFTCSSCQNCFDAIRLKVVWICDCVYFYVFDWFQRRPQATDVASPNPDIKRLQGVFGLRAAQVGTAWISNKNAMRDLAYIFSIPLNSEWFWPGVGPKHCHHVDSSHFIPIFRCLFILTDSSRAASHS